MKNLILLFLIVLSSNFIYSNKIDRLRTDQDVEEFVLSVEPSFTKNNYSEYEIPSTKIINQKLDCKGIIKKWKIKNWEKVDINHDGKTDLLFIIANHERQFYSYLIVDKSLNGFVCHSLSNNPSENCELFKPIKIDKKQYLKHFTIKKSDIDLMDVKYKELQIIDTLTYKFDEVIEFEKHPDSYQIKTIEYSTGCSDGCPFFSFKIKNDGTAYYNGKWNTEVNEPRKIKISIGKFKELEKLIGYIRLKQLKNKYSVPWFHGKSAYLKITFDDNSEKIVDDYGSIGTYGLSVVYGKLEEIVKNQIWK